MEKVSKRMRDNWLAALVALTLLVPAAARSQDIIINEILAGNNTTAPLVEFPEYFPDYVELYNNSSRDIDLGLEGWSITDEIKVTNKYRFPIGLVFPADSYLLVFCDNESPTNFPGLDPYYNQHTLFNLDARGGENIALFRGAGASLVTSNGFGIQVPGFSVGRFPGANAGTPFVLTYPTPCGGTVPCKTNLPYTTFGSQFTLKINEWVCTNTFGTDWLEVFNPDTNIVELGGLVFTDDQVGRVGFVRAVPDRSYIAGQSFIRFWCDSLASKDADHLDFSLSSGSELSVPPVNGILDRIYLFARDRFTVIDNVIVGAQLFRRPGYSQGRIPDGGTNLFVFSNPTPEDSNTAPIPEININELLAHVDPPLEDALELQNVTSTNVDISYWWITDNKFKPKKYWIPAGTIVPAGQFAVFYEYQFNSSNDPVHVLDPFNFNSANGGECYLFKGDAAGNVLGFRKGVTFGASRNGVSFGRYVTSDGNVEFIPMWDLSFGTSVRAGQNPGLLPFFRTGTGATNPPPRPGPIVINEIHYKPINTAVESGGPLVVDDSLHEYVELRNISTNSEALYYVPRDQGEQDDRFQTNGWKLDGIIGFDFPPGTDVAPGIIMAPNEYILLVNFNPATNNSFNTQWRGFFNPPVPANVRLFGPYKGKLSNSGGSVQLYRPDAPQRPPHPDAGLVPYVLVERAQYSDHAPWPSNTTNGLVVFGPDGGGASLQRSSSYEFANDPINWSARLPTPGRYNSPSGLELPYPLSQPQDFNGSPGLLIELAFPTRGDAPITYQWYRNDLPVPGANSSTHIFNAGGATAGNYHAVASNPAGSTTSRVASVTVNCPFLLSTDVAAFGPAGGTTNITVAGSNGCFWTVGTFPSWITYTTATKFFEGTASFDLVIAPYTGTTLRTAAVQVAEQAFVVMQSPADSTPPTVAIDAPGIGARVTTPSVVVRGKAMDAIGISRVEMQVGSGTFATISHARAWQAPALLAPGTNWIRVRSFDVVGNMSAVAQRPVFFSSPTPLSLVTNGSGKVAVAPAATSQGLEIGRNYTLTATPNPNNVFSNWLGNGDVVLGTATKLTFNMQPGTVITASFVPNPFIPANGVYSGLFQTNSNVRHTNAGFFKLTTTAGGTYTASIKVAGKSYTTAGKLDLDGRATNTVNRLGLAPLTVVWSLGLNGEDAVNGTVNSAGWDEPALLHGDRAVFNARTRPAPARRYTVIIPPDPTTSSPSPQGYGYGTAVLNAGGTMTFVGTLADGTKVSQAVSVARTNDWENSMWPLYVQLYANRGMLIGWVNTSLLNDLLGTTRWLRPAGPTPKYYTNGFDASVSLIGSIYRPPAAGVRIIDRPAATVLLALGNLAQPSANVVNISPNSIVSYAGPNTLTIKFTPASGLFTGTFIEADTTRRITFNGAVNQRYAYAQGFFLGTNETGQVLINDPPSP